ncbi:MAG: hypothetical protein P4L33_12555 [Capsulimonadaceae bacterium]|nr:hypothetical protein [Capsulimonadaceae bacterium]
MMSNSPQADVSSSGGKDAVIFIRDLPASIRELLRDPPFWKEVDAFAHIPKSKLAAYHGRYIAVYDGEIVDSDPDEAELAERFYGHYGLVPVYIHKVGTEDGLVDAVMRA